MDHLFLAFWLIVMMVFILLFIKNFKRTKSVIKLRNDKEIDEMFLAELERDNIKYLH